jgi:hypothetical protein
VTADTGEADLWLRDLLILQGGTEPDEIVLIGAVDETRASVMRLASAWTFVGDARSRPWVFVACTDEAYEETRNVLSAVAANDGGVSGPDSRPTGQSRWLPRQMAPVTTVSLHEGEQPAKLLAPLSEFGQAGMTICAEFLAEQGLAVALDVPTEPSWDAMSVHVDGYGYEQVLGPEDLRDPCEDLVSHSEWCVVSLPARVADMGFGVLCEIAAATSRTRRQWRRRPDDSAS